MINFGSQVIKDKAITGARC